MINKILAHIGMWWHKRKCTYKIYDIGNQERVVMECGCGRYWSWDRTGIKK